MTNKTIQELKENFYILFEKYKQKKEAETGKVVYPNKAEVLDLFLNETERYIGGRFDHARFFTHEELDVLSYAHTLLFKLQRNETSSKEIYRDLREFAQNTKAFYDSVYEENYSDYHRLLNADKNINTTHYDSTPLILAIQNSNLKMVSDIIQLGADVNQRDKKGLSPLYHAIKGYKISSGGTHSLIVQYLLQAGARTENLDGKGTSALVLAVQSNRPRCVMMLAKDKYDRCGYIKNEKGENVSFLNYAIRHSLFNVFQVLIAGGAKIDEPDGTGLSPVQTAQALGKKEFVGLMADVKAADLEEAQLRCKKIASSKRTDYAYELSFKRERPAHLHD